MLKFLFSLLAFSVLFNRVGQAESMNIDGAFQSFSLNILVSNSITFNKVHIDLEEVTSKSVDQFDISTVERIKNAK